MVLPPIAEEYTGSDDYEDETIVLDGGSFERPINRRTVNRANVWQVLSQSPAAWRVDGGTGGERSTSRIGCKELRNRLYCIVPHHNFEARRGGDCELQPAEPL